MVEYKYLFYRYIAVGKPHKYREFNNRMNVPMRILIYSGPVLALSFLLNIPKFYEIDVSYSARILWRMDHWKYTEKYFIYIFIYVLFTLSLVMPYSLI